MAYGSGAAKGAALEALRGLETFDCRLTMLISELEPVIDQEYGAKRLAVPSRDC